MIAGAMGVIVLAIAVAAYFAWRFRSKEKQAAAEKIERLEGAQATKMSILGALMVIRNKSQYKMKLMEDLSIDIEMMKVCVAQLKGEKLVTEQAHAITLTDFGKKYAQVYVEQTGTKGTGV